MKTLDLKKIRFENGNLTQSNLADILGVTLRTIRNYEKGGDIPHSIRKLIDYGFFSHSKIKNLNSSYPNSTSTSLEKGDNDRLLLKKKEDIISNLQRQIKQQEDHSKTKDKQIESLERQIASLQSNMDIIINAKDELLKAREEMIKKNEELIVTQKQHIKELSRKNNIIDLTDLPATDQITVGREGDTTVIKQVKKISPSHSVRDAPRPSGRK